MRATAGHEPWLVDSIGGFGQMVGRVGERL